MDRPDEAIQLRHDPVRIGQVVTNLVGNGIKFTPRDGSVRVQVRREPDGGASITVADTGIGIDPAELPRIFDRFFRGQQAAQISGSGIGLAVAAELAQAHGGRLTAASETNGLGHGTQMTLSLPSA
jgi:histidine kinase